MFNLILLQTPTGPPPATPPPPPPAHALAATANLTNIPSAGYNSHIKPAPYSRGTTHSNTSGINQQMNAGPATSYSNYGAYLQHAGSPAASDAVSNANAYNEFKSIDVEARNNEGFTMPLSYSSPREQHVHHHQQQRMIQHHKSAAYPPSGSKTFSRLF